MKSPEDSSKDKESEIRSRFEEALNRKSSAPGVERLKKSQEFKINSKATSRHSKKIFRRKSGSS